MNRNKVLLRTCENFSRTPRKTCESPSQDYVPPASIKPQNDDKTINININIIN